MPVNRPRQILWRHHKTANLPRAEASTQRIRRKGRLFFLYSDPDTSLLSILCHTDQPMLSIRANIKLAISGGQNEPRDAIAGAIWALLTQDSQLKQLQGGENTWLEAFEEYARWISPIGMSPRRITQDFEWNDIELKAEERLFFMFGSANRDEDMFENPEAFDFSRDTSKAISLGAGPHFARARPHHAV